MRRTIVETAFAIVCATALACSLDTGPRGCDICTTSAIVFGTVRSASGTPVPGARVSVEARETSCRGTQIGGEDAIADTSGAYRVRLRSPEAPTAVCLVVTGVPPTSSGMMSGSDTGHVVRMQPDYGRDESTDSVRVDLTLPPNR